MDEHLLHLLDLNISSVVVAQHRHVLELVVLLIHELNVDRRFLRLEVLLLQKQNQQGRTECHLVVLGIDHHIELLLLYHPLPLPTFPQLLEVLLHLRMLHDLRHKPLLHLRNLAVEVQQGLALTVRHLLYYRHESQPLLDVHLVLNANYPRKNLVVLPLERQLQLVVEHLRWHNLLQRLTLEIQQVTQPRVVHLLIPVRNY